MRPTSGRDPAPRAFGDICAQLHAAIGLSPANACASVLATTKSTPWSSLEIMLLTALPPAPPTPRTVIRGFRSGVICVPRDANVDTHVSLRSFGYAVILCLGTSPALRGERGAGWSYVSWSSNVVIKNSPVTSGRYAQASRSAAAPYRWPLPSAAVAVATAYCKSPATDEKPGPDTASAKPSIGCGCAVRT